MSYHEKLRVGVLRGGPSSEYEVSLKTGAQVLAALAERYHPFDIFIDRAGAWHMNGVAKEPHLILRYIDVIVNALHGEFGEDGTVQHLLETHRIPFCGSRQFGSMLAQNKGLAKNVLAKQGIQTPYFRVIRKEETPDIVSLAAQLYRSFPQPSIIKPVAKGSSLGVSLARAPEEIAYALELAFQGSDAVMVEERIDGSEAVCAVIEGFRGEREYALLPVQVVLPEGSPFFDYHAKYGKESRHICPGNFAGKVKKELQTLASKIHRILELRHYSSCDFIVHPKRGIYFLEADSLPVLWPDSPFQVALQSVGSTMPQFLEHIILLAIE